MTDLNVGIAIGILLTLSLQVLAVGLAVVMIHAEAWPRPPVRLTRRRPAAARPGGSPLRLRLDE